MPKDGFKDRIFYIEQETDEECDVRKCLETEEERINNLRSTYSGHGRAYGNWVPKIRSKIKDTAEAEQ